MKKLLNLMMMILLVTIVGCSSDDNEGTFELPTNSVGMEGGTSSGIKGSDTNTVLPDDTEDIAISVNGVAAGIRIIEPATIVLIDSAGSNISTTVDSHGSFSFVGQSFTAPYVLFLVSGNSHNLDWNGDIQARIVTSTSFGSFNVNPLTTSVALTIFNANDFDLFNFAKNFTNDPINNLDLLSQYSAVLSSLDDSKLNDTSNIVIASWGTSKSGDTLFTTNVFDSINYMPRKTMQAIASPDHLLIEALGVYLGNNNLGGSLANNTNLGSNILLDKGFQEGLVFVLYSLNKYQPFAFNNMSNLLSNYLTNPADYASYANTLQEIVDNLLLEEINSNKSEAEIKAKIKTTIAFKNISF